MMEARKTLDPGSPCLLRTFSLLHILRDPRTYNYTNKGLTAIPKVRKTLSWRGILLAFIKWFAMFDRGR